MRLKRFRVTDFRSVDDSGWIEVDIVTALIGVNESGKTNLLVPLWKLNPAREGEIQPTSDYPKKKFGEIREDPSKVRFITADFETGTLRSEVAAIADISEKSAEIVRVCRYFDGSHTIKFPKFNLCTKTALTDVQQVLTNLQRDLETVFTLKMERELKNESELVVRDILDELPSEQIELDYIAKIKQKLIEIVPKVPAKTSKLVPRVSQAIVELQEINDDLDSPAPGDSEHVVDAILELLPKFVYYSNYGNLDSEIYLPHVVENLKREDLGTKEEAKARTLRILFSFVKLSPDEILELGREFDEKNLGRTPSETDIADIAENKRERSILLQSAEAALTTQFKHWWLQGDYRFELQADGNHFRIWVSDDRRPEKIELENRSTGLQWFLSFFLVFLVESQRQHRNAVLLLDEPGLSLHPLAQRDLSMFFRQFVEKPTESFIQPIHRFSSTQIESIVLGKSM